MRQFLMTSALVSSLVAGGGAAQADSLAFDPNQSCNDVFNNSLIVTQSFMGAWALGFLSGSGARTVNVNEDLISQGLALLRKRCRANPEATLVQAMKGDMPEAQAAAGSEADVRQLLAKFMKPGADTAALTYSLKPLPDEVRMVYREPLASKMIAMYDRLFTPKVKIGPHAGQTKLLTFYSTTAKLASGDPMRDKFPGGYKDVYQYMKPDFPIVRFKFVKPGETLGMASDGFIFVNNHWVFMPKPWTALAN